MRRLICKAQYLTNRYLRERMKTMVEKKDYTNEFQELEDSSLSAVRYYGMSSMSSGIAI